MNTNENSTQQKPDPDMSGKGPDKVSNQVSSMAALGGILVDGESHEGPSKPSVEETSPFTLSSKPEEAPSDISQNATSSKLNNTTKEEAIKPENYSSVANGIPELHKSAQSSVVEDTDSRVLNNIPNGGVEKVDDGEKKEGNEQDENEEDDDDRYEYSDDFEDESGEESDIEDNDDFHMSYPVTIRERNPNPELPETVTVLNTDWGSKVYLVGTAHFSVESQEDVAKTIQATHPDVVMVELCNSRINILQLDEQTLLDEAKNINMEKIRTSIKQSGVIQGIMHLLFLTMSAHLTKELGMAPGGEFRRAFTEAQKIPGCRLQLGDRPIEITLRRGLSSLSWWQKLRLTWHLITSKDPITKEDVEKCKQKDLLEEMLKEMTGEFPALSRVFVEERDTFLANSLKFASQPFVHPEVPDGIPKVVVGVVGIGHVPGIVANWDKDNYDITEIMTVPEGSRVGKAVKWGFRLSLLGIVSYACYRFYKWTFLVI